MLSEWGILGRLELARQILVDAWPEGLTWTELEEALDCDVGSQQTFLMQLTRYCFISESRISERTLKYYVDPKMDERFERRILPYDRLDENLTVSEARPPDDESGTGDRPPTRERTDNYHGPSLGEESG